MGSHEHMRARRADDRNDCVGGPAQAMRRLSSSPWSIDQLRALLSVPEAIVQNVAARAKSSRSRTTAVGQCGEERPSLQECTAV